MNTIINWIWANSIRTWHAQLTEINLNNLQVVAFNLIAFSNTYDTIKCCIHELGYPAPSVFTLHILKNICAKYKIPTDRPRERERAQFPCYRRQRQYCDCDYQARLRGVLTPHGELSSRRSNARARLAVSIRRYLYTYSKYYIRICIEKYMCLLFRKQTLTMLYSAVLQSKVLFICSFCTL